MKKIEWKLEGKFVDLRCGFMVGLKPLRIDAELLKESVIQIYSTSR
jgi:hypothetical protein